MSKSLQEATVREEQLGEAMSEDEANLGEEVAADVEFEVDEDIRFTEVRDVQRATSGSNPAP